MKVQIEGCEDYRGFYGIPFDASTRHFDAVDVICKYVKDKNIPMMIYLAPINQSILAKNMRKAIMKRWLMP